jgi:hypothetical protein
MTWSRGPNAKEEEKEENKEEEEEKRDTGVKSSKT